MRTSHPTHQRNVKHIASAVDGDETLLEVPVLLLGLCKGAKLGDSL